MESDKNPTFIFKEINETSKTLHVFLVRSLHYPSPTSLQREAMFQAFAF